MFVEHLNFVHLEPWGDGCREIAVGSEPMIDAPVTGPRQRSSRVLAAAAALAFAAGLTAAVVKDKPSAVVRVGTAGDSSSIGLPDLDVPTPMVAEPTTTSITTPTTNFIATPTTTSITRPPTAPVAKVPFPTITLPTLRRPQPTTTTTTTTTAPPGAGGRVAPVVANSRSTSSSHRAGRDRCGTPLSSANLGATRAVTQGTLTVTLVVYACEHYDGEFTQNFVHVEGAGAVLRAVHLDFGDGTATDVGVYRWACDDPKRPNPYHANGPFHTYTAAGAYTVNATVTTAACSPPGDGPADVETTTVTLTTYQIAGSRPRPPH